MSMSGFDSRLEYVISIWLFGQSDNKCYKDDAQGK